MPTLIEFLTLRNTNEHVLEHDLEHDLTKKKQFSTPKIYTASENLSKRWYVYFSFRDPKTGKLSRMKNIYGTANTFHTKEERLTILSSYQKNLLKLLKKGYNPLCDNNELFANIPKPITYVAYPKNLDNSSITMVARNDDNSLKTLATIATESVAKENTTLTPPVNTNITVYPNEKNIETHPSNNVARTLQEAFDFALNLKTKIVSERTLNEYSGKVKNLIDWLNLNHPDLKYIHQLNKHVLVSYLNDILSRTSARNRNNYRVDISSVLQVLEDNDIITVNFMKKIKVLKSHPKRNKTYTVELENKIFKYLEKEDPILLLFIKCISYNFLRPIEVCRIKIGDIDLIKNEVNFQAKNASNKTKIIPEMLLEELPDLSQMEKHWFLFTPDRIGGVWEASETNRRDHFTKRYNKVVKKHFKLDINHSLYSFRHTYITKLYRKLRENKDPYEAKSNLMLITGHSSMTALEKYLRDIDAELPLDYSHMFK
jgi:integrase